MKGRKILKVRREEGWNEMRMGRLNGGKGGLQYVAGQTGVQSY